MIEPGRDTTVLFADIIGAQSIRDASGDVAAEQALGRCMDELGRAADANGGRVANRMREKLMVLVATPDGAADVAVAMHTAMKQFKAPGDARLTLGIAFHHGPVSQKGADIFGDTVILASQLGEHAGDGQIITSEETARSLGALYRAWMRRLGSIAVKGRSHEIALCELVWRADDSATAFIRQRAKPSAEHSTLRLRYRGKEIERRREKDAIAIGRDPNCGLVIDDDQASRVHCTIERRHDKFVLVDQSTNGTYVTVEGADEVQLTHEEFTLGRHGWISFGQPRVAAKMAVEFFCD
jgi:adenylate cyclase